MSQLKLKSVSAATAVSQSDTPNTSITARISSLRLSSQSLGQVGQHSPSRKIGSVQFGSRQASEAHIMSPCSQKQSVQASGFQLAPFS